MKKTVSIWYILILAFALTSCLETKDGKKDSKNTEPQPNVIVPQIDPSHNTNTPSTTTTANTSTTNQDQSKLSCIQSLCGTEYVLEPAYSKQPDQLQPSLKIIEEKFDRILQLRMGQAIKNNLATGAILEKIDPSLASSISLSKTQTAFMTVFKYLNNIKNYYSAIEYDSAGKIIFNKTKLKENNPKLTADEVDAIASLHPIFQTSDLQQVDPLTYNLVLTNLKKRYAIKELGASTLTASALASTIKEEEILKHIAEKINEARLNTFSKVFTKELLVNEIQYVVDMAIDQKPLSVKQKLDLIQKYGSYLFISILIEDEGIQSSFGKLSFPISSVLELINKNFKETFSNAYADKNNFKKIYSDNLNACKNDLAKSLHDTPTPQEISKAALLMNKVADVANALVNKKSNTSEAVKINFLMPNDQNEVLADLEKSFNSEFQEYQIIQDTIKNMNINDVDGKFITSLFVLYNSPKDMFATIRTGCKAQEPSFLTDAAIPAEKTFRASAVVVKNIEAALGVVAHEVGHIMQYAKSDLFKSELYCLEDNYKSKQYRNEDFADLFSAKVMSELKLNAAITSNKNMICTFPEFKQLKLEKLNLVNASKNDEHSSALYRLLAVSSASNSMTQQCLSYLDQYEPQVKIFNNYCKWQD